MRVFIERDGRGLIADWVVTALTIAAAAIPAIFIVGALLVAAWMDARVEARQREALRQAVEESRAIIGEFPSLERQGLRQIERSAGVSGLRLVDTPSAQSGELQSVMDRAGRIIGWLSFDAERPAGEFLERLWPFAALCLALLAALGAVLIWQLRRTRALLRADDEQVDRLRNVDPLTGVDSHRRSLDLLDAMLAGRKPGEITTIADLDLDGFKDINDRHGHSYGDKVLAAFGERLKSSVPAGMIAGRLAGDEFLLALNGEGDAAVALLRGVCELMQRPLVVEGRTCPVSLSAGIARSPVDATGRDELIRKAHVALRAAKAAGRGRILAFEESMEAGATERRQIAEDLRQAIERGELDVHYQPIIAAAGARIVGVEALLRWTHPERGSVAPMEFVTVVEETGQMSLLGQYVLRRALSDAGRWPEIYMSVNLSPVQVRDRKLADDVARLLGEHGIAPAKLTLEMTESVLVHDPDEAKRQLDALRELGVQIALDDFGTGYSSLSYLQRFAFDKLKIDRSFVEPLGRSGHSGAMIQAIVALGNALGLKILAEGVETEGQRVLL
ncbi:MAG: bifunctional diguanylate cyclase/phosphodiesterase, partial [Pseudorhodoplanes sp.]|nr:bifunctional diguanylate cyclase/phosphodiesterase [Pseudorhodoplanes sp.]